MPKLISRAGKSDLPNRVLPSATLLAMMPAFAIFYILLILPFFPDDGKGRMENILFWPILAVLVLTLVFLNRAQIDYRFFRSVPIVSLIAYLVFAARKRDMGIQPGLRLQPASRTSAGADRCRCAIRSVCKREICNSGRVSLLRLRACRQLCLCPDNSAFSNRSSRIFYPQTGVGSACRDRHHFVEL